MLYSVLFGFLTATLGASASIIGLVDGIAFAEAAGAKAGLRVGVAMPLCRKPSSLSVGIHARRFRILAPGFSEVLAAALSGARTPRSAKRRGCTRKIHTRLSGLPGKSRCTSP